MDKNEQPSKATEQKRESSDSHSGETDLAKKKNKENQVTEARQKGKDVDRDVTDPSTNPEE